MNESNIELSPQISDNDAVSLISFTEEIDKAISNIHSTLERNISKRYTKFLMSIAHYKVMVQDLISAGSYELNTIMTPIITLKSRADDMMVKAKDDEISSEAFNALQTLATIISKQNANLTSRYSFTQNQTISAEEKYVNKISASIEILRGQIAALQNENNQSRTAIQKTKKQAENTDIQLSSYAQRLSDALEDISGKANSILSELAEKKKEVNELVGLISGDAVSGSYTTSATIEKKTADSMRNGSVMLMLLITLLLAFTLFDSGRLHFDIETAIFRFVLSLALSVPVAYLARESSKHRAQQYLHQRTALDLQAVTPYIASLPEEEQHRLKADIANRIFGKTEQSKNNMDSYPINLQELFMAAISKIEPSKSNNKEN